MDGDTDRMMLLKTSTPLPSDVVHNPAVAPAVAIITPYYNAGPFFAETVAAVMHQTLQQWEWVIVNDGSTDEASLSALAPLRSGDPRVCVIDGPNRGPSAARNAGVAATSAPLLFFLDSDDLLAPTALEQLAWLLHSDSRPAFATSWITIFGAEQLRWPRGFDTRDHFLFENMVTVLVMVRRAAFEAVGGFDPSIRRGLEDYEFWLRCADRGFWGRDIPEYLIQVRRKSAHQYIDYRWAVRDDARERRTFVAEMQARYPVLYRNGLPQLPPLDERPFAPIPQRLPFENRLNIAAPHRLLLLLGVMDLGGVSTFALAMLRQLTERGYHCTVCATIPGNHALQAEFERYADVFVPEHFLLRPDIPRFLRYLIGSRKIDIVLNSNSVLGYRLLPYLRAHFPQVAQIDYTHMRDPGCANEGNPGFSAEYADLLDLQLASSRDLLDWMLVRGASYERSAVLYTSSDIERWWPDPALRAAVRAEFAIDSTAPVLLHAARITAQKQPQVLARVLLELAQRGLAFRCLVAGDGPDMPWLRAFVRKHQLEGHVTLLGAVDAERVRALMAASDILFLPSAYEGLALVLFEAMACATVPVTVDSGGQRELVTPDCGMLVPPDELQEQRYAAALEWLIRAPRQRAAMAAACRDRVVDAFAMQQMGAQLDLHISAACARARARASTDVSAAAGLVAASQAIEELRHYQRNHRLRLAVQAWEWWKARGSRYVGLARAGREELVRRSYPLRLAIRPTWHRVRRRWRVRGT